MTLNDAVTRWEDYLKRIESLLDDLSEDIQNDNFVDNLDATVLICLHSQLCSVRFNARLGGKLIKATLEELKKSKLEVVTDDESENN